MVNYKIGTTTAYTIGTTGQNIKNLQTLLNKCKITGSNGKPLKVDGQYGNLTNSAVLKAQQGTRDIQGWLNKFGFKDSNNNPLKIDGLYGDLTASAVKKFQAHEHIVQDGETGDVTLGYMKDYGTVNGTNSTTTVPDSLKPYLQATKNCQSDNATLIAVAKNIITGCTTVKQKAEAISNWVRDHTDYAWYENTRYGALGEYNKRVGDCCDMSHLNIALARAAGIPAKYEHVLAKFSSGIFGHVIAKFYVEGSWLTSDGTSNNNALGVVKNWSLIKEYGVYAELPF